MILTLIPLVLNWLPGGVLQPILAHLQKKADTETERLRITVNEEIERRKVHGDVLAKEADHWIAWLPRFLIAMSVALYVAAIFIVSVFQVPWTVLKVPAEMEPVMSVVIGGLFLEKVTRILKR